MNNSGRWTEVCVPTASGRSEIIIASYWGVPGASEGGSPKVLNERLLTCRVARPAAFRHMPYFLCGDFNTKRQLSTVLSAALSKDHGFMHDIVADWASPEAPQPTFRKQGPLQDMRG